MQRGKIVLFGGIAILLTALVSLALGEAMCRIAGVGGPNLTLTGPKRLYVPDEDPRIAFRMRPGYREFVYGAEVAINGKGLRCRDFPYEKPAGSRRILVLGDSVAFGYGVPAEDAFPQQLEALLRGEGADAEVINAGVPAYTTVQEVRWFETEGVRYGPDAVIVAYVMNDPEPVHRLAGDGTFVPLPIDDFYRETAELFPGPVMPGVSVSNLARFLNRLVLHAHPNWMEIHGRLTRYFCEEIFEQPGWGDALEAFRRLKALCEGRGIRLLAAVYPTMYRLHSLEEHPFTPHYETVERALEDMGIECLLPMEDYLGRSTDAMRAYVDDPHPSAESHGIFARRLREALNRPPAGYNTCTD